MLVFRNSSSRVLNHNNWWFETPKVDAAELQPLLFWRASLISMLIGVRVSGEQANHGRYAWNNDCRVNWYNELINIFSTNDMDPQGMIDSIGRIPKTLFLSSIKSKLNVLETTSISNAISEKYSQPYKNQLSKDVQSIVIYKVRCPQSYGSDGVRGGHHVFYLPASLYTLDNNPPPAPNRVKLDPGWFRRETIQKSLSVQTVGISNVHLELSKLISLPALHNHCSEVHRKNYMKVGTPVTFFWKMIMKAPFVVGSLNRTSQKTKPSSPKTNVTVKVTQMGTTVYHTQMNFQVPQNWIKIEKQLMRGSHCCAIRYERHDWPFVADRGISQKFQKLLFSPRVHHVSTTCPPRVHHVSTTCPPRVHHVVSTCTQRCQYMYTTNFLPGRCCYLCCYHIRLSLNVPLRSINKGQFVGNVLLHEFNTLSSIYITEDDLAQDRNVLWVNLAQQIQKHFSKPQKEIEILREYAFCEHSREPASTVGHYPMPSGQDMARSPQSSEARVPKKMIGYCFPTKWKQLCCCKLMHAACKRLRIKNIDSWLSFQHHVNWVVLHRPIPKLEERKAGKIATNSYIFTKRQFRITKMMR
ncbi:hypothetical protein GQR58_009154 [Nymphon striatum]|nr:hypothetical protein GQR58_009154 [Nymphon striatum]